MGKFKDGLKAYLNLIKLNYNINNKRMIEIEKQVEYLDDEIRKILKNYPDGKIEMFPFIIYMGYLLSAIIDEDGLLESFIKILRELYNTKKEP